jgi:hypothetical protein
MGKKKVQPRVHVISPVRQAVFDKHGKDAVVAKHVNDMLMNGTEADYIRWGKFKEVPYDPSNFEDWGNRLIDAHFEYIKLYMEYMHKLLSANNALNQYEKALSMVVQRAEALKILEAA